MCHKHLQALQAAMGWINVQVHIFLREDQPALPPTPTTPVSPVVKFKEENENSAQLEERVKQLEKRLQESEAKAATLQVKFEEKSNKLVQQIQAAQSPRQLPAASSSSSSSRSSSEEDAPPPPTSGGVQSESKTKLLQFVQWREQRRASPRSFVHADPLCLQFTLPLSFPKRMRFPFVVLVVLG